MTAPLTRTPRRERQHRRSMLHPRPTGELNPLDYEHCAELAQECAVKAVMSVFRHLSAEQIERPPRVYKDAQFARQIAIRIMARDIGVVQRHISRMQRRQRTSIHFAVQAVERRIEESETFSLVYCRMADAAVEEFQARGGRMV